MAVAVIDCARRAEGSPVTLLPSIDGPEASNGHAVEALLAVEAAVAEHAVGERNGGRSAQRELLEQERRAGGGRRGNFRATRVSVVIPALNEARNLRHVLTNLPDGLFEVLLVPGSSTDNTVEVARTLQPEVRVIRQTRNGKGNALACAFAACLGDIVITLDADGSANPQEIPAFVGALLSGADFAKGTRFIQGGGSHDMTALRQLGNWGLTRLANLLHGTHYSDLCYGYNAFWRRCLPQMNVDIDGFEVETLINLRAAKSGLRVTEVASFELERIHGRSNLKTFRDGWRVLGTILREWVPRRQRIAHTPPGRLEAGERRSARRSRSETSQPDD
jgi:glycosyltransferase involved in cell wall biosynthesis